MTPDIYDTTTHPYLRHIQMDEAYLLFYLFVSVSSFRDGGHPLFHFSFRDKKS